jgi:hypothetical protein
MKNFLLRLGIFVAMTIGGRSLVAEVPTVKLIQPAGVQRGTSVEVELSGDELKDIEQVVFYSPGLEAKDLRPVDNRKVKMTVVADEKIGCDLHAFRVITKNGISNVRFFGVSPFPSLEENEAANNSTDALQVVPLNTTINGVIQSEDVDYFAVEVPQGEMISAEIEGLRHAYSSNQFDPYIAIYDADGNELTSSDDSVLLQQDCVCSIVTPQNGRYVIEVRESSYGGSRDSVYRLHIGNFARPMAIYPSGGKPGSLLKTTCIDSSGNTWEESFQLPFEEDPKFKVWSTRGKVQAPSPNILRVSQHENYSEADVNKKLGATRKIEGFPAAINGCIATEKEQDVFVFNATKDQSLDFRLVARDPTRSPLDGVVTVSNSKGRTVASNDDSATSSIDSSFSFKATEDGEYTITVRSHLGNGSPRHVYRLEVAPPTPKLTTTVKEQERYISQTIPVHRGARMAVDVLLDRKNVSGPTDIIIPDLPDGMEQVKAVVAENSNHVQLMLRAKTDAPSFGKLVDLSARIKNGDNTELIGHMDQRSQIIRGLNNRDVWGLNSDKLAVAILDPLPFDIEVVQPNVPIVRDGTMPLIVKAIRKDGFKRSIRLKVLDNPPGVTSSTSVSIAEGQDQVELPITANSKASLGKWPITVLATTKIGDNSTVTVASEFIELEVADRLFEFEFAKTMAEVGKNATVNIGIDLNREVDGKIEVELVGLPPGTTMVQPKLTWSKGTKRLSYELTVPKEMRNGVFKTIAARGTVTSDKGVITQVNGTAEVQIDPARSAPVKGVVNKDTSEKPLSRLEELRKQREDSAR